MFNSLGGTYRPAGPAIVGAYSARVDLARIPRSGQALADHRLDRLPVPLSQRRSMAKA